MGRLGERALEEKKKETQFSIQRRAIRQCGGESIYERSRKGRPWNGESRKSFIRRAQSGYHVSRGILGHRKGVVRGRKECV